MYKRQTCTYEIEVPDDWHPEADDYDAIWAAWSAHLDRPSVPHPNWDTDAQVEWEFVMDEQRGEVPDWREVQP